MESILIDLSFIGWDILNILTLQILGVFFLEPYKRMTTVELYMTLREKQRKEILKMRTGCAINCLKVK